MEVIKDRARFAISELLSQVILLQSLVFKVLKFY